MKEFNEQVKAAKNTGAWHGNMGTPHGNMGTRHGNADKDPLGKYKDDPSSTLPRS